MSAAKEQWEYAAGESVWAGKYKNSQNILHWHNDCELIYAEKGELDVTVDNAAYVLSQGCAMFIDGAALHRISARTPDTLLKTIIFDSGIISDFAEKTRLCDPVLSRDYGISSEYEVILRELTDKKNLYTLAARARVFSLMLDIFRNEPTEQRKPRGKTDAKLRLLFEEMRKNFDAYTLNDAAGFMGMNASYLSRFFAERTGMHFVRYLNCLRVENAVALLAGGEYSVTEVANRCGFDTIRNFNRIFKLLTGYTPSGIPDGYEFAAIGERKGEKSFDPTLFGCELIESSMLGA